MSPVLALEHLLLIVVGINHVPETTPVTNARKMDDYRPLNFSGSSKVAAGMRMHVYPVR